MSTFKQITPQEIADLHEIVSGEEIDIEKLPETMKLFADMVKEWAAENSYSINTHPDTYEIVKPNGDVFFKMNFDENEASEALVYSGVIIAREMQATA